MFLEINNCTEPTYEDEIEDDIELYSSTGIIDKAPIMTIFDTIEKKNNIAKTKTVENDQDVDINKMLVLFDSIFHTMLCKCCTKKRSSVGCRINSLLFFVRKSRVLSQSSG